MAFRGREDEFAEQWLVMARELASFMRVQRWMIGGKWKAATERAVMTECAYTVCCFDEKPGEAFIVCASPEQDRAKLLQLVGSAAYVNFSLRRVVVFGTAPINATNVSMQMAVFEDIEFSDEDAAQFGAAAKELFGAQKHSVGYEYAPWKGLDGSALGRGADGEKGEAKRRLPFGALPRERCSRNSEQPHRVAGHHGDNSGDCSGIVTMRSSLRVVKTRPSMQPTRCFRVASSSCETHGFGRLQKTSIAF